jgi:hypothetical protein
MTAYELVQAQAEDAGLWFIAETAPEAYLQQELRRLHAAVEAERDFATPFEQIIEWLRLERERYQTTKWDYSTEDLAHAREGLGEDSWTWQRGVENYVGRVRLFGHDSPAGVQAYLKLIATLTAMLEHLLHAGDIELPEPGHTSGELRVWT